MSDESFAPGSSGPARRARRAVRTRYLVASRAAAPRTSREGGCDRRSGDQRMELAAGSSRYWRPRPRSVAARLGGHSPSLGLGGYAERFANAVVVKRLAMARPRAGGVLVGIRAGRHPAGAGC